MHMRLPKYLAQYILSCFIALFLSLTSYSSVHAQFNDYNLPESYEPPSGYSLEEQQQQQEYLDPSLKPDFAPVQVDNSQSISDYVFDPKSGQTLKVFNEISQILAAPQLQVKIPGLNFSDPARVKELSGVDGFGNTVLTIPYLGEYFVSIYTFSIGAMSVLAVVMIIVGGFMWSSSGGSAGQIQQAQAIIQRAVIGLIIGLGSYMILYLINPELVQFQALKVRLIEGQDLLMTQLGTTTADTIGGPGSIEITQSNSPTNEGTSIPPNLFENTLTACPINFENKNDCVPDKNGKCYNPSRTYEFYEKIRPLAASMPDTYQRVSYISQAAIVCGGITMGSCGTTAGTILALAGIDGSKGDNCMATYETRRTQGSDGKWESNNVCNGNYNTEIFKLDKEHRRVLYGQRCNATGGNSTEGLAVLGGVPCANTSGEATKRVRDYLWQYINKEPRLPAGYPDTIAKELRPGDYVVFYNGNTDLTGAHALLFIGWDEAGNFGKFINSSDGKGVSIRSYCITVNSPCGKNGYTLPIVNVYSPIKDDPRAKLFKS